VYPTTTQHERNTGGSLQRGVAKRRLPATERGKSSDLREGVRQSGASVSLKTDLASWRAVCYLLGRGCKFLLVALHLSYVPLAVLGQEIEVLIHVNLA